MARIRPGRKGSMRIAAGYLKNRLLYYPKASTMRPTMQRAKISMFDSLGELVIGSVFIDLFAAAGGIGIEAASRGAAMVHFVEHSRLAAEMLRENLRSCGLDESRCKVHHMDVYEFLEKTSLDAVGANIVYADPPYGSEDFTYLLEIFDRKSYPRMDMLIIEHSRELPDGFIGSFRLMRTNKFGSTKISYFKPAGGEGP